VLGSGRTLTAKTRQRVAYFLRATPRIGALRLLNTFISVTNLFWKRLLGRLSQSRSQMMEN